jgi:hypothetical protein
MALIKCNVCSSLISDLELRCPNCENILTEEIISEIRAKEKMESGKTLNYKNAYSRMGSRMVLR